MQPENQHLPKEEVLASNLSMNIEGNLKKKEIVAVLGRIEKILISKEFREMQSGLFRRLREEGGQEKDSEDNKREYQHGEYKLFMKYREQMQRYLVKAYQGQEQFSVQNFGKLVLDILNNEQKKAQNEQMREFLLECIDDSFLQLIESMTQFQKFIALKQQYQSSPHQQHFTLTNKK